MEIARLDFYFCYQLWMFLEAASLVIYLFYIQVYENLLYFISIIISIVTSSEI
jgi:hypothetical protein